MSQWEEPGRSVADDGRIVYAWPPEGRPASGAETSTLVAYQDEAGRTVVRGWLP